LWIVIDLAPVEVHLPVQFHPLADSIVLLTVDKLEKITIFAGKHFLGMGSLGLSAAESACNEPTGAPGVLAAVSTIKGPLK
jgi:hypothetical protein